MLVRMCSWIRVTNKQEHLYGVRVRLSVLDFSGQSSISGTSPGINCVLDLSCIRHFVTFHWKLPVIRFISSKMVHHFITSGVII